MFNFILVFIAGLILGSFLNSLSFRLPIQLGYAKKIDEFPDLSFSNPRSFCPNCKNPLSVFSLIPVFSYLIQSGKCKNCKEPISITYPFFEILLGILFALLFIKSNAINYLLILNSILVFTLILVARIDENFFKIPIALNLIFLFNGILLNLYNWTFNLGVLSFFISLFLLVSIKYLTDFILKKDSFGWGDIILISNLSLFFGIYNLPFILFISSLSGIIWYFFKKKNNLEETIAFGPHIALSGIWLLFIL